MTGYRAEEYARSLAEFGGPVHLARCDGWILERAIPGSGAKDGMSCYPLFSCSDWSKLNEDVQRIGDELVSISLVIDPFSPLGGDQLCEWFDVVRPFKEHFVIDTDGPAETEISKHHRYYSRKALDQVDVEIVADPPSRLDDWCDLYETLIARHQLRGIKAFSRESFAMQLRVPGLVMFLACGHRGPVGAHLWFVQDGVAHSHLAAFNGDGYAIGVAYALYWEAIRTFRARAIRWIDLGAGAGTGVDSNDGLTKFKSGWTGLTRTKYYCGRILDPNEYRRLVAARGIGDTSYFPAYRQGEF